MLLIGQNLLDAAGKKNVPLRTALATWAVTVAGAEWSSLDEVRWAYPSADGVKLRSDVVVTVFNVKGNEYRLLTRIDYVARVVRVLGVLPHADYSKEFWKARF